MSTRLYSTITGESRIVLDSAVRFMVGTGKWSTSPTRIVAPIGDEPPDLSVPGEEPRQPSTEVGANLQYGTILSLYEDGVLPYEQALAALGASGLNAREAELVLAARAPQAKVSNWQEIVAKNLRDVLSDSAKEAGFADHKSFAEGFLDFYWDDLTRNVFRTDLVQPHDTNDPSVMRSFIDSGIRWLQQKWGYGKLATLGDRASGGRGGGRRAGGTAVDLRNQFDLDQLAGRVTDMWQTYLLADPADARAIAKDYVDLVVSNPARTRDFSTWVKSRMKQDPKWSFVYQNKPAGVSEESFIGFYAQKVLSTLGPGAADAGSIIRSQAALASSPDALAGRLKFHENVAKSTGFLNRIESRYRSARDLLGAM